MDSYRPLAGTPVDELDTPCLLVDLDAVERNFRAVADTYRDTTCKMRQHTKNIKSPLLARMQIEAGGTLNGVCTAKVSEAEVMVEGGITDILIPNQIVTRDKIARLCALARRGDMKVCVDDARNVRDLSEVAEAHGVTLGVLIEVDTQMGRAGVRSAEEAVELARLAERLPGVRFRGVMSHQALMEYTDNESRVLLARETIQACLSVKDAIEEAGIPVEMVSSGETFSYDVAAEIPGVTEVEGGTYALMCTRYDYMKEFEIANKVLGTVISTPRPGIAIGDVGTRALSWPSGESPAVEGMPGVTVETLLDEHVVLRTDGATALNIGDKFLLLPWYQDMMVDRWDRFIAVRDGVVQGVWDIPGRGCTQ
jgi:3-hydroxy-D-aspartate aldolase